MTWYDGEKKNHTISVKNQEIPDTVDAISEDIIKEILECSSCKNGFNITSIEIYLHTKIRVPLPDSCWKCRFKRRFDSVNLPHLYNRNCAKCNTEIKTSYSNERQEIVYCEKCYQQEIS
jgi:hypothetical protein